MLRWMQCRSLICRGDSAIAAINLWNYLRNVLQIPIWIALVSLLPPAAPAGSDPK
jgi:hypothetical protein